MAACKCAECGLVGRYNDQMQLTEYDAEGRKSGARPYGSQPTPYCSVHAADLSNEIRLISATRSGNTIVTVLDKVRECDKFFPWKMGFTPKEHQEMIHTAESVALQKKQLDEDRLFHAEQREKDRIQRDQQRTDDKAWQVKQKFNDRIWQLVMAVGTAILGSILTIILFYLGIKK